MNTNTRAAVVIALGVVVLLVLFSGGAMSGGRTGGGMMGGAWMGGFGWMGIPAVLIVGLVALLVWGIVGKKK